MWNYLFGGAKQKKELPKKAIVDLREHINTLNKKSSYLESQIQDQEALARKYVTTNKNLARNALKKKKKLEGELLKIENQIESLEVQLGAIESANLNGARAIKQMHSDFDIDKVDETMDEIREQVEASEEISEAISRPLGSEFVDEDELDEELAALQEEEINSHMVDTHNDVQNQNIQTPMRLESPTSQRINNLPSAPTKKVQPQQQQLPVEDEDEDERALRELQAEMGM
ncbi:hypothetical protein CAS74_003463 [Pichia kudriavzevii]|uniref:Vacuolar-sorting protein SNF7 n=1 Tax=Pichia kudriavzevii TaxID=4909 RepID=A0A1Z8JL89_PICKU|nr:hypothetical protein CAS74_003463 [Pichia kudriavzevii]